MFHQRQQERTNKLHSDYENAISFIGSWYPIAGSEADNEAPRGTTCKDTVRVADLTFPSMNSHIASMSARV